VEGADALGLIAEVGIAIAGFAGVIVTLRAPGGTMETYATVRIGALFGWSATAVLAALVPFALHFAGLAEAAIWALSSSALAALVATVYVVLMALDRSGSPAARAPGYRFTAPLLIGIGVGAFVLQGANAMFFRELWPFYVGLLAIMLRSLFQFAYVLFAPSRSEVRA
jgi:hypothetical protein